MTDQLKTRAEHIEAVTLRLDRYWNAEEIAAVAIDTAIEHGMPVVPERTRISRGDVIESRQHADRYDVPDQTVFYDQRGDVLVYYGPQLGRIDKWMKDLFPLRCFHVPNTDGRCPTCALPGRITVERVCPTCLTDYGQERQR